ncbi:MAG: L-rhamnose mutarotase [Actinobacteria bacterium]|nr:L-rhamnose mutarotase [Actinomycetota bacterium]
MIRVAQTFRIDPAYLKDYKKDHDNIWPEMKKLITDAGIENYSIFFRSDGTLFSYYESRLDEKTLKENMEKASMSEVSVRWQKAMDKYFVKQDKNVAGPEMTGLEEVFHMI